MVVLRRTQIIHRPPEEVFAVIVDAGDFAGWNPTIRASRRLDSGEIGEGSRFVWKLRGFGDVEQELQDFAADERVRIVPCMRSLGGGHLFVLSDLGDGRTRLDHELEMDAKGAFVVLSPMMGLIGRKNLRDTAMALEEHLESGSHGG